MIDYEKLKKEISIIDYAIEIGLTPAKVGSRYYTLKEHDSVRIDPIQNIFIQNSTGKAGSIIDFAMCFTGRTYNEVVSELVRRNGKKFDDNADNKVPVKSNSDKKKFVLPEADRNMKNIFAYLIKARKLSKEIIQRMVDSKQLYQDIHKNCVFVSYKKNKAVFACKRGTNTEKRFVGDVAGSDYSFLFFIDQNADNLIIAESVIDALSIMEIMYMYAPGSEKTYNYLSLCGCSKFEEAVTYHMKNNQYKKVLICLDNDKAGNSAANEIKKLILRDGFKKKIIKVIPKNEKDFNDQLISMKTNIKEK